VKRTVILLLKQPVKCSKLHDMDFDDFDNGFDKQFNRMRQLTVVWMAVCGLLAVATLAGVVWLVVELLPHVVAFIDRVGR
jgi:hypothetical protein